MGKVRYLLLVPLVIAGAASACEGRSVTKHRSRNEAGQGGVTQTGGSSATGGDAGRGSGGARGGSAGSDAGGEDSGGTGARAGEAGQGGTSGPGGEAGAGGSGECDCSGLLGLDPRAGSPCVNGVCVFDPSNCLELRADCDGIGENGCETNLELDPLNCGRCGNECPNSGSCEEGACTAACEPGFAFCNDDLTCDPLDTESNCGACGHRACSFENTIPTCSAGTACLPPLCRPGYANCSGDHACESAMTGTSGSCYPTLLSKEIVEASISVLHVATGAGGETVVAGRFKGEADFDPTSGVDTHAATSDDGSVFVSKYSRTGGYAWTRSFDGGESSVGGVKVAFDGSVVVAGAHLFSTDFDPGSGSAIRTSEQMEAYVVKLRSDGSLDWVRTFPILDARAFSFGNDVALDSEGAIYTTGIFSGGVDFDPSGAGGELSTEPSMFAPAQPSEKVFLVKLAPDGAFGWVWSHSGSGTSWGSGVSVSGERVWLTGSFFGNCRFDQSVPALSTDRAMAFLLSTSRSGAFQGQAVIDNDAGTRVATNASSVFLTTWIEQVVDLDPGSAVDRRTVPLGGLAAARFDASGAFAWSQTFSRYVAVGTMDPAATGRGGLLVPSAGPWLDESNSEGSRRGVVFLVNGDSSPGFTLDLGAEAMPHSVAASGGLLAVAGHLEEPGLASYGPTRFFVARYGYDVDL